MESANEFDEIASVQIRLFPSSKAVLQGIKERTGLDYPRIVAKMVNENQEMFEGIKTIRTPVTIRRMALHFIEKASFTLHPSVAAASERNPICFIAALWHKLRPFTKVKGKPMDLPDLSWKLSKDVKDGVNYFCDQLMPRIKPILQNTIDKKKDQKIDPLILDLMQSMETLDEDLKNLKEMVK